MARWRDLLVALLLVTAATAVSRGGAAPQNLVTNGEFDSDVAAWHLTTEDESDLVWLPLDAAGSVGSGSMGLVNHAAVEPPTTLLGLPAVQCIPIQPGLRYALSAYATVPADQPEIPGPETAGTRGSIRLQFSNNPECTFAPPFPPQFFAVLSKEVPPGQWVELNTGGWAETPAVSAHVALTTAKGLAPESFTVAFDRVMLVALPYVSRVPMLATGGD